ncbi:MAG: Fic family protein [Clostridia bacterium]|nr:Fic family protein [Clostridia bacterium]
MYSYDGLNTLLKAKGMKKSELTRELGISSRTIAKIGKGERLADHVILRLCDFLGCKKEDIFVQICDNKVLQALREEKNAKISGGIYHETQVRLTYNSNRIEGSKLSEDQTRLIFETNTIGAEEGIPVDDIIETANHFRAIDYIIDCAEEPLTERIIKELHRLLKTGTKDSHLSWFNVGEYKSKPNVVGGKETTTPSKVPGEMKKLVDAYSQMTDVSFEDIIKFHHDFEKIHPFQDGNGRVGRLIAFKEALRFDIVPFIIEDSKKMFYYRGLKEWNNEKGFLIETCLDGQDTYKALLRYFGIPFSE